MPPQLVERGAEDRQRHRPVAPPELAGGLGLVHTPQRAPSAAQTPQEARRRLREGSPRTRDPFFQTGARRDDDTSSDVARRALSAMLNELDGMVGRTGVFASGAVGTARPNEAQLIFWQVTQHGNWLIQLKPNSF